LGGRIKALGFSAFSVQRSTVGLEQRRNPPRLADSYPSYAHILFTLYIIISLLGTFQGMQAKFDQVIL
jgi:hypothetical protein